MNYRNFLNKSSKFENNKHFIFKDKKKNSKTFLISSVLTIAALSTFISLFIDSDNNTSAQASESSATTIASQAEGKSKITPLDLPEIAYRSQVLSQPVIYTEKPVAKANQPENKQLHNNYNSTKPLQIAAIDKSISTTEAILHKKTILQESSIAAIKTPKIEKAAPLADKQNKTSSAKKIIPVNITSASPVKALTTKTVVVKKGDTLSAIFKRLSLSGTTLHHIINSSTQAKRLTRIKPGQKLMVTFNSDMKFKSLQYDLNKIDSLIVEKGIEKKQYAVRVETKDIDIRQQFAAGTITNSLFSAGNKAGLSNTMIMQLAQLFGWDIDFALDIRKGDSFTILFEEKYINDKKIGNGNILMAEFVNKGKLFTAIRYTDSSNHTDYYSEDGLSMRKAFLRTPVDFSRISSRFSSSRKHPVLNKIRAHKGVDYAAARGTPIKAVGDGKVIFKGKKGGYGRVIILQHGSKYSTLYAHMNSYNKKMRHGTRVKQGQIIGYVGSSGLATGPHLHYEFRMNGVHRNPLTVPLPSASPIAKKYRSDFQTAAETMISQLKLRKQETVALSEQ